MNNTIRINNDETIKNAKIEKLVAEYVQDLKNQAVIEKGCWLETGRLVSKFVKESGLTNEKAFQSLADHEDSVHGVSQLRNYLQVAEIYDEVGEDFRTSKLSMTHFTAVQNRKLSIQDRKDLLIRAQKEGLSVSALKMAVREKLGVSSSDSLIKEKLIDSLRKMLSDLSKFNHQIIIGNQGTFCDSDKEIKDALNRLLRFAVNMNLIDPNDILSMTALPSKGFDELEEDAA